MSDTSPASHVLVDRTQTAVNPHDLAAAPASPPSEKLREALRKIANGREVRQHDGTTIVEDVEDAAEIARKALVEDTP